MDRSLLKSNLRARAKEQLSAIAQKSTDWRLKSDRSISEKIFEVLEARWKNQSTAVGIFRALRDEPNIFDHFCQDSRYLLAFPRVVGEGLNFSSWSKNASWRLGPFGLQEPIAETWPTIELSALKALCIPGLAFDESGRRLGRGKGYYDRTLANYKGLKIGVAYEAQVFQEDLPAEAHDVSMDVVVSEAMLRVMKG